MNEDWKVFLPRSTTIGEAFGDDKHQQQWGQRCYASAAECAVYLRDNEKRFTEPDFAFQFLELVAQKRKIIGTEMKQSHANQSLFRHHLGENWGALETPVTTQPKNRYRDQYEGLETRIKLLQSTDDIEVKKRTFKTVEFKETTAKIVFSPKDKNLIIYHPKPQTIGDFLQDTPKEGEATSSQSSRLKSFSTLLQAILLAPNDSDEDFSKKLGELSWYLYQVTPFGQGSAAITDILGRALILYRYPTRDLQPYSTDLNIDLLAMVSPKHEFMNNFSRYCPLDQPANYTTESSATSQLSLTLEAGHDTAKNQAASSSSMTSIWQALGGSTKELIQGGEKEVQEDEAIAQKADNSEQVQQPSEKTVIKRGYGKEAESTGTQIESSQSESNSPPHKRTKEEGVNEEETNRPDF